MDTGAMRGGPGPLLAILLLAAGCDPATTGGGTSPNADSALVLRADFSDQKSWRAVRAEVRRRHGVFVANVDFRELRDLEGLDAGLLSASLPRGYDHSFVIVADRTTMSHPDHPLLVVDLSEDRHPPFRALPSQIGSIENNLSLANMDFREFAEAAGPDGIFRGFAQR